MGCNRNRTSFRKIGGLLICVWILNIGLLIPCAESKPIPGENDRIGWSADGNRHDPDDWGATALALAIFAKQGWQDKLVHFDYNNWLPDNTPFKSAEETISVREGVKRFKFSNTKLFDCQTDLDAAINNVVEEINKSSEDSRFWYVQAGPFEVAYLALLKAIPAKRKYCILVSHSAANDRPEHWPGQHGKDDCVALGATFYYTTGQGKNKFGSGKFHEWHLVDWMKDSPCPDYRWVYSRFKKTAEHKHGVLDASDGGMAFVLVTGDTEGNFNPKLKNYLGTDWKHISKAGGAVAAKRKQTQKKQQAIEKVTKVYDVDHEVVAEFNRIKHNITPSTSPTQSRKLLIYAISHGPHRFVIPTGNVILRMLGETTGAYTAVVSHDLAHFEPEALKQFDAVCFANTTGEVFYRPIERHLFQELSPVEKQYQVDNAERLVKNLADYVRNGGGFFGIHAATDTLKKTPTYGEMIGGYFNGHPWSGGQTVRVRVEQPQHPLCADIFDAKGFSIKDEIYQMKDPYARDQVEVLLSVDVEASETPAKPMKRKDKDFPLAWVKTYGKGRVFYSALGHNKSIFCNALVLQHWLEGLQYVLGDKPID